VSAEQQNNLAVGQSILAASPGLADAELTGAELFFASQLLSDDGKLLRALTDPGRTGQDRAQLARDLFAAHLSKETLQIIDALTMLHWSRADALPATLEHLGIESYLRGAQKAVELRLVESELFAVSVLLSESRDLRVQLSDLGEGTVETRAELIATLLDGHISKITIALVKHAVLVSPHGRLIQSIRAYARIAAQIGGTKLVTVTAASELTGIQRERMKSLIERQLNVPVTLAVAVDKALIGGFRINYGEEAVDSSIRSNFNEAKLALER
jgi:F0F1-type ATP synthase, delta subunit (mitochondrial oligomycin sensitivity protein)